LRSSQRANEHLVADDTFLAISGPASPTLAAPAFGADSIAAGQLNAVLQAEEHIEAEPPPEVINGWLSNAAREYPDVRVTTRLDGMEVPGSWAGTSLASCRGLPARVESARGGGRRQGGQAKERPADPDASGGAQQRFR